MGSKRQLGGNWAGLRPKLRRKEAKKKPFGIRCGGMGEAVLAPGKDKIRSLSLALRAVI